MGTTGQANSSQGEPLCTCASNSGQCPGLTVIHRAPSACEPLPQDGHTAPELVQQGPFLGSLGLWGGQDTLLLESMQLFGETCGCYVNPQDGQLPGWGGGEGVRG